MPRKTLTTLAITAAAAAVMAGVIAVGDTEPNHALGAPVVDASTVPVLRVVDGDTFDVPEGRVRILVMDSCERGTAGGARATADAHRLLDGQRVTLTAQPGHDRDRYGRLLRYVRLPDGRDYAEVMLAADHTAVYAGRSDASRARLEAGRGADVNGRSC